MSSAFPVKIIKNGRQKNIIKTENKEKNKSHEYSHEYKMTVTLKIKNVTISNFNFGDGLNQL